jgi:valyl-tRNA synthetase
MPFITEEIYQALPPIAGEEDPFIMTSAWPEFDENRSFPAEETAMETIMDAIRAIRARRAEMNVAPGRKVRLTIVTDQKDIFTAGAPFFQRLAAATEVHVTGEVPSAQGQVEVVTHAARVFMPLAELVDVQQELERVAKEKAKAQGHLKGIEAKLNNEAFTSKAPEHIVQNQRDQAEKLKALIAQLEASEANLRSFS